MQSLITSTPRLHIRTWGAPGDLEALYEMYRSPEVVRFIGGKTLPSPLAAADFLARRLSRCADPTRLGYWAATRHDATVVGAAILDRIPLEDGAVSEAVQVGWHLHPDHWGCGYATEMGAALLRYARQDLGLGTLHCLIEPGNDRSVAVAGRLGLPHVGQTRRFYGGVLLDVYGIGLSPSQL